MFEILHIIKREKKTNKQTNKQTMIQYEKAGDFGLNLKFWPRQSINEISQENKMWPQETMKVDLQEKACMIGSSQFVPV